MTARVARRYAKALFALARDAGVAETVATELGLLRAALSDPATLALLASPVMTKTRLTQLSKRLATELQLSELTTRFLGVLADNRRIDQLPGILDRFEVLHDRALGRTRVVIRSAAPLDDARQSDLVRAFEQLTGKTVLATVHTDADLLGGVVVEADGKVYDGSVRTQLVRLARDLAGTRAHL
jgi:F-type H+-transporting ATPase subunit delta